MGERGGYPGVFGVPDTEFLIIWTPWSVLGRAIYGLKAFILNMNDIVSIWNEITKSNKLIRSKSCRKTTITFNDSFCQEENASEFC